MDSINLYYPPQAKQLSEIFKVMQIPHKFFIDLIYGRPSKAHYWQKILGFNDGVHFFSELPLFIPMKFRAKIYFLSNAFIAYPAAGNLDKSSLVQ